MGVSLRTWQHWEKGATPMRAEHLRLYRLATLGERADPDRARLEDAFLGPPS